ncbi:ParB/RepB/Spo0J family partition protein [Streptomyces sp. Wb2n-11]|uniref:ParB/RepB/Spo0J family partition protein n=1 Tax=Streptomyces sp. Wb2n-11 TaxID=1030533 RepID=UPI000A488990|nr:ParB/RepB/Spo0J family partition protein [Streptomyces sp. Wb2n-11]
MSKAKNLGAGASFGQARPVSARRAAIGAVTAAPTVGVPDPTELPLNQISQNPDNPRDELRDLEGLADSIREIGLVNAITVASADAYLQERPDRAADIEAGARYIVVDGHRRLEAARLAGAQSIRVSIDNARVSTDESLLEAAFVANVHRDDMSPLEQAQALRTLVDFYGSQNKAAKRLGMAQSTISSKLSILDLDPALQADLITGRRKIEDVRNLSNLTPEQQREKADARAQARQNKPAAARGLSRRDNPQPAQTSEKESSPQPPETPSDLSRRDKPEPKSAPSESLAPATPGPASTTVVAMTTAPVPEPRPASQPTGAPEEAPPTLPSDGVALMEYVRDHLNTEERSAMLQRYFQVASGVEEVAEDLRRGLLPEHRRDLATILHRIADLLAA